MTNPHVERAQSPTHRPSRRAASLSTDSSPPVVTQDDTSVDVIKKEFMCDVNSMMRGALAIHHGSSRMQLREAQYSRITLKVKKGQTLTNHEVSLVCALNNLCNAGTSARPSENLSWMMPTAQIMHENKLAFAVDNSDLAYYIVTSYRDGQDLAVNRFCKLCRWKDLSARAAATGRRVTNHEDLVACSLQITTHFVMRVALSSFDCSEDMLRRCMGAPIPRATALALAGYHCGATRKTLLGANGEFPGTVLTTPPPPWRELVDRMKCAIMHNQIRTSLKKKDIRRRVGGTSGITTEDALAWLVFGKYRREKEKILVRLRDISSTGQENSAANITVEEDMLSPMFDGWYRRTCEGSDTETKLQSIMDRQREASLQNNPGGTCNGGGEAQSNSQTKDSTHPHQPGGVGEGSSHGQSTSSRTRDDHLPGVDDGCFRTIESFFNREHISGQPAAKKDENRPRVVRHTLPRKGTEARAPEVISIENALGKECVERFTELHSRDDIKFHRGERGRDGSLLRFVTLEDPVDDEGRVANFQIGRGDKATRYECLKAEPLEAEYLNKVNKMLCAAEKARYGEDYQFVPFNAMAINVYDCSIKAGYSFHADGNNYHFRTGDDDEYPRERLPPPEDFSVLTSSFTREFVRDKPLRVVWADERDLDHPLATVNVGRDLTHYQARYVNFNGRKHAAQVNVECAVPLPPGAVVRVVMTARTLVIPSVCPEAYDAREKLKDFPAGSQIVRCREESMVGNAIGIMENPGQDYVLSDDEEEDNEMWDDEDPDSVTGDVDDGSQRRAPPCSWNDPEIVDRWKQCTSEEYKDCNLPRLDARMSSKEPVATMYARSAFHQKLLERKVLLRVLVYPEGKKGKIDESVEPEPVYQLFCFNTRNGVYFPLENAWYPEGAIVRNGVLKWTTRNKPPVRADAGRHKNTVIGNSKLYKKEHASLRRFLEGGSDDLVVFGSAGAPDFNGDYGVDLIGCLNAEDMTWASYPHPQEMNSVNEVLEAAVLDNRIVAFFISRKVYDHVLSSPVRANRKENSDLRFLGFFEVVGSRIVQGDELEELREEFKDASSDDQTKSRFCEMPHRRYDLKKIKKAWVKSLPRWDRYQRCISGEDGWSVLTVTNSPAVKAVSVVPREGYKGRLGLGKQAVSYVSFADAHFRRDVAPLLEDLPTPATITECTGTDASKRDDSLPWAAWVKERETKKHPQKVTVKDVVRCLLSVSFAGSCRLLKRCLSQDGEGGWRAHPLPDYGQGAVLRAHSVPMANRSSDVGTITLMNACLRHPSEWENTGNLDGYGSDAAECLPRSNLYGVGHIPVNEDGLPLNRYCRMHTYRRSDAMFLRDTFRSLISTVYGEVSGLTSYFKYGRPEQGRAIPAHGEAEHFASHMEAMYRGNISNFYRSQYKNSIPDPAKKLGTAVHFIRSLGRHWESEFCAILRDIKYTDSYDECGNRIPANRKDVIAGLSRVLSRHCPGTTPDSFLFVASLTISNTEELYGGSPFGVVGPSNTLLGPGSLKCLDVLEQILEDEEVGKGSKKRKTMKRKGRAVVGGDTGGTWMDQRLSDSTYKAIMDEIKSLSQEELSILLLFRDDTGEVRSKLNGRRANSIDVEHYLCKVYIMLRKKSPVVQQTEQPECTLPHCHPVRTSEPHALVCTEEVVPVFRESIEAWGTIVADDGIWTPAAFLFREEWSRAMHLPDCLRDDVDEEDMCGGTPNRRGESGRETSDGEGSSGPGDPAGDGHSLFEVVDDSWDDPDDGGESADEEYSDHDWVPVDAHTDKVRKPTRPVRACRRKRRRLA